MKSPRTRARKKKPAAKTWYSELSEDAQKSLADKSISIEAGRVFISIGDARFKVGTGGYITLAHKSGIIAEGSYTSDAAGKIVVTWEHVLKLDGEEWKVSSAAEQEASLVKEFTLSDGTSLAPKVYSLCRHSLLICLKIPPCRLCHGHCSWRNSGHSLGRRKTRSQGCP